MWVNTCIEGSNPSFSALPRKVRPRLRREHDDFPGVYGISFPRLRAAPAQVGSGGECPASGNGHAAAGVATLS
jgi:hypothetical protein